MTQEEKDLLLRDLCARLPYGVKVHVGDDWAMTLRKIDYKCFCECWENEDIKSNSRWMLPYLRPMSSMTEEEMDFANDEFFKDSDNFHIDDIGEMYTEIQPFKSIYTLSLEIQSKYLDWLNANHFDYRGLIPMGLALEAPEGMYN